MRRLLTATAVLGTAVALAAPVAQAADRHWDVRIEQPVSAAQLGVPATASAPALARAAIARHARRLGLEGSLRELQLSHDERGTGGLRTLRFRQTAGGLRVAWSELDVIVTNGRVSSIAGTTVPLRTTRLRGTRRIGARQATRIARRSQWGPDVAAPPALVAYAGSPGTPVAPRRSYLVQVTSTRGKGEDRKPWCIVVDAETGKVMARWAGTAALPAAQADIGPQARASATTVLYQLTNFKRTDPSGYPYGLTRLTVTTTGNPQLWGSDNGLGAQFFDVFNTNISFLAPWVTDVTRFFCLTRKMCGRRAGNGVFGRYFLVGNHTGDETYYSSSDEHIIMGENDADDPDVLAHEIGHSIDHHWRNDYLDTFEADEIDEALADMFSYDWDRNGLYQDGPKPVSGQNNNPDDGPVLLNFGDPAASGDPAHYNQYDCGTGDEHDNGSILSHGYHRLVTKIGHPKAGQMLGYVPNALPARREFGDVRQAFEDVAMGLYNGGVRGGFEENAVEAAFAEVGVFDQTRRNC